MTIQGARQLCRWVEAACRMAGRRGSAKTRSRLQVAGLVAEPVDENFKQMMNDAVLFVEPGVPASPASNSRVVQALVLASTPKAACAAARRAMGTR